MVHQPLARSFAWATALAMLPTFVLTASCDMLRSKDEGKCTRSMSYARKALEQEKFELVRQYREYIYKNCEDPSVIDAEIKAKYAEIAERKAKNARATQVLGLFVHFASKQYASPTGQCFSAGPDAGWCKRSQSVSGSSSTFDARYNQRNTRWVRFDTVVDGTVGCNALGAGTVRTWRAQLPTGGVARRSYCTISGGQLNGFSALVSVQDDGTRVTLVSPIHLSNDAFLRRVLEKEGVQ